MSSPTSQSTDKCPVDEKTRTAWLAQHSSKPPVPPAPPSTEPIEKLASLPTDRETSSIPRASGSNWVYPSQSQFYAAMARKHSLGSGASPPNPEDMPVVVPIHNAVNEKAWAEVLRWEEGRGGEKCGGVKLLSFKGKPKERTWKAWGNILLGYQPPFDRHDWVVDRCGHEVRYIIDFYTGRSTQAEGKPSFEHPLRGQSQAVSFYLDVRPAPDTLEGIRMRMERTWNDLVGRK